MRERPIPFSAPMVRAILEGRKTMTRRVKGLEYVNSKPDAWEHVRVGALGYKAKESAQGKFGATFTSYPSALEERVIHVCPTVCPYGQPGDRLWVREAYGIFSTGTGAVNVGYRARLPKDKTLADTDGGLDVIRPEDDPEKWRWANERVDTERWRPSIFMPRWASRINLEIVSVRIERLQNISGCDAQAEGIAAISKYGKEADVTDFSELWDSINAKKYPWSSNPFVWCISFKRG